MHNIFMLLVLVLIAPSVIAYEPSTKTSVPDEVITPNVYVVKNVNIIPMTKNNKVIESATVVIQGNKIIAINGETPLNAEVIDGTGKWLIPGLIDMHIHGLSDANFRQQEPTQGANVFFDTQNVMTPYVANGVTTIFDLSARPQNFGQRNEIAKGDVIGPRMALAKLLDGGQGLDKINSPADGRQAVRSAKADGYGFIKPYSNLEDETFWAIVDEAKKHDLNVVGHIPNTFRGRLKEALVPNFSMVAHAEEFSKEAKDFTYEEALLFAQMAKENGIWLTPTLTVMVWIDRHLRSLDYTKNLSTLKYMHPIFQDKWVNHNKKNNNTTPSFIAHVEQIISFNKKLVKAFKEVGAPIVVGTDAMNTGVVPGFSLHDELALLVEAGMTPEEVLISATRLPATWLGIDSHVGTVEENKYADLVLLNANPLDNIKNSTNISGVFVNGVWLNKMEIDNMLLKLETFNSANKDKYQWRKRRTY